MGNEQLVHVKPVSHFVKEGKLYELVTLRTYEHCPECGELMEPGERCYRATWLHTGLGEPNVPDYIHVNCAVEARLIQGEVE